MTYPRYLLVAVCTLVIACLPCVAEKIYPTPTIGDVAHGVVDIALGVGIGRYIPKAAVPIALSTLATTLFIVQPGINVFQQELESVQWSRKAGPVKAPVVRYTPPCKRIRSIFDRLAEIRKRCGY